MLSFSFEGISRQTYEYFELPWDMPAMIPKQAGILILAAAMPHATPEPILILNCRSLQVAFYQHNLQAIGTYAANKVFIRAEPDADVAAAEAADLIAAYRPPMNGPASSI